MIRDFSPSQKAASRLIAQELFALVAAGALYPFGVARPRARTPRHAEQRTVVMIHGYLGNRSTWLPLATYLRLKGHRILYFNYASSAGVAPAALALRDYLRRHVRGGRIDLVAHSLGGLVARFYLQELGGARRVDRCITLATPHSGTYNAYWLPSRVGDELRPDSAIIARLARPSAAAARVRMSAIVAGSDNIIVPRVFSAHEEIVHLPDLGHVSMLFSPRMFRAVAARLAL